MFFAAAIAMGTMKSGPTITVKTSATIPYLRPVALASAPTGSKVLVCNEDGSVRILDAKTHQVVRILAKHIQPAYAAAWSPDGEYVATGDETARIFIENALTGQKVREYRTHTKGIQKLSFNRTRQYLISTGKDDQINVYDLSKDSKKEARKILGKGANFYGATFSPTLPYTFSTGILGPGGRTYDASNGRELGFLTTDDTQGVFDIGYNAAGTRAVTAGKNGEADVFDTKSMKKVGALVGHKDFIMYTAFSPNGNLIATGSTDRSVDLWNAYTFQKVAQLENENTVGSPVCFTADGNSLVTVSDAGYLQINTISPCQAAGAEKPIVGRKKGRRRHRTNG